MTFSAWAGCWLSAEIAKILTAEHGRERQRSDGEMACYGAGTGLAGRQNLLVVNRPVSHEYRLAGGEGG